MFSWCRRKGYAQGVFWAILVCIISSLNDISLRYLGRLDGAQVAFLRFFASAILLLPVMMVVDRSSFRTQHLGFHMIRAACIYGAILFWSTGMSVYQTPLAIASTLAQTTALFVLPMASFFLKERISKQCIAATVAGFIGILITIQPGDGAMPLNWGPVFLVGAAVLFAASDIFNKVMVSHESTLTMMFYIALGAALFALIPACYTWKPLLSMECAAVMALGAGANLILFCLLRAVAATKLSDLMPYRYLELIFAGAMGYILFGEAPSPHILAGAALIIFSTATIGLYESRRTSIDKTKR